MTIPDDPLALADWRRRVTALYAAVRQNPDGQAGWQTWRAGRDALLGEHSQSPLAMAQRIGFKGLPYAPYDPDWRLLARVDRDVPALAHSIDLGPDGVAHFSLVARLHFARHTASYSLNLYWLNGYGGGLFLPFRDATGGRVTYGGGRYLLDTIKGADLGLANGDLWLDFNFAYNPSCAYDGRWVCPLAPPDNYLPIAVVAGELAPPWSTVA